MKKTKGETNDRTQEQNVGGEGRKREGEGGRENRMKSSRREEGTKERRERN